MKAQNQTALAATLETMNAGTQFTSFEYAKPLATNRNHKGDEVIAVQHYTGALIGTDYRKAVERKLSQVGAADTTYTASKSKYNRVGSSIVLYELNGTLYMRVRKTKGTKCSVHYLLNGVPATREQIAEYVQPSELAPHTECRKQADAGLHGDEQVKIAQYRLDRIIGARVNKQVFD